VADSAIGGEAGCDVIWIGRPGEIRLMTAVASCGQCQIIIVGVASCAGDSCMRAGERERSGVVIEGRTTPVRCGVARGAGGGEASCGVWWRIGPGVIGLVARIAVGRDCCVVVVCVALCARQRGMCAGEREDGGVIEGRCRPRGR